MRCWCECVWLTAAPRPPLICLPKSAKAGVKSGPLEIALESTTREGNLFWFICTSYNMQSTSSQTHTWKRCPEGFSESEHMLKGQEHERNPGERGSCGEDKRTTTVHFELSFQISESFICPRGAIKEVLEFLHTHFSSERDDPFTSEQNQSILLYMECLLDQLLSWVCQVWHHSNVAWIKTSHQHTLHSTQTKVWVRGMNRSSSVCEMRKSFSTSSNTADATDRSYCIHSNNSWINLIFDHWILFDICSVQY